MLRFAGASLQMRDGVDRRIMGEIQAGKGRIINSQNDVGGWPVYDTGRYPFDQDGDGMPDGWEKSHGLNPLDGTDQTQDPDGDGYTNLEEFINGQEPSQPENLE